MSCPIPDDLPPIPPATRITVELDTDGTPLWTAYAADGRQLGWGTEDLCDADMWRREYVLSLHGVTMQDGAEVVRG